MRYSIHVKPIDYSKAKAALQDVASYEEAQETLALLKILAMGDRDIAAGNPKPAGKGVARLRQAAVR